MTRDPARRHPIPLLPLLMILLGGLLLVANFGLVSWGSLLEMWALWPLLLIALGLDLISRGSLRIPILLGVVAAAVLVWSGTVRLPALGIGAAPAAEIHAVRVPLGGADLAEVRLAPGVAELTVVAAPGSGSLIEGQIGTGRGEQLIESASLRGNRAIVELRSETERPFGFGVFAGERHWDLTLSDRVPLELIVESGVGRSELDLRGLELRALRVDSGVGDLLVTLPASGGYHGSFDSGVGSSHIRIPAGVAAAIEIDSGVGGIEVRGDFVHSGDRYHTPDFEQARERIELRIDSGVGSVVIEQIR